LTSDYGLTTVIQNFLLTFWWTTLSFTASHTKSQLIQKHAMVRYHLCTPV